MNCEEERKLFKSKLEAENKFKAVSLPLAAEPLGVETPPGHSLTKEHREEIRRAQEELNTTKETYEEIGPTFDLGFWDTQIDHPAVRDIRTFLGLEPAKFSTN